MMSSVRWRGTFLAAAAFVLAFATDGAAQATGTVVGKVTETGSGRPLVGAQVFVAGTTVGSVTNERGEYRITGAPARQIERDRVVTASVDFQIWYEGDPFATPYDADEGRRKHAGKQQDEARRPDLRAPTYGQPHSRRGDGIIHPVAGHAPHRNGSQSTSRRSTGPRCGTRRAPGRMNGAACRRLGGLGPRTNIPGKAQCYKRLSPQ